MAVNGALLVQLYCAYPNTGREFFFILMSRKQTKKIGRGKSKEKYNDTIEEDKSSSERSLLSLSQIPTKRSLHCLPFLAMKPNDFSVVIKRGTEQNRSFPNPTRA